MPYLLLFREDSPQRQYDLRVVFNAVRYVARTGCQWRFLPNDLLPWYVVFQQIQRWLKWGCFEILVEDTRLLVREWAGRRGQPTAVCIDNETHAKSFFDLVPMSADEKDAISSRNAIALLSIPKTRNLTAGRTLRLQCADADVARHKRGGLLGPVT